MRKYASLLVGCLLSLTALGANDSGSFGRSVRYLDVGLSGLYLYSTNMPACPTAPGFPTDARCVNIPNVAVTQAINELDNLHIDLPASATNSLLCFSITPQITFRFANTTTSPISGVLLFQTNATIESTALANPALINKVTGLPFDGKIALNSLATYQEIKTLQPNSSEQKSISSSKECINGLISLSALQSTYGLSLQQARTVLARPMTVRFNTTGQIINVAHLSWRTGVRLFGD